MQFLVTEKGFKCALPLLPSLIYIDHSPLNSEERVRKGAEKLSKYLNTKQQGRLDGFFTVTAKPKELAKVKGKDDKGKKGAKRKVRCVVALCLQVVTDSSHRVKIRNRVEVKGRRARQKNEWMAKSSFTIMARIHSHTFSYQFVLYLYIISALKTPFEYRYS